MMIHINTVLTNNSSHYTCCQCSRNWTVHCTYTGRVDLSCTEGTLPLLAPNVWILLITVCTIPDRSVGMSSVLPTANLHDCFLAFAHANSWHRQPYVIIDNWCECDICWTRYNAVEIIVSVLFETNVTNVRHINIKYLTEKLLTTFPNPMFAKRTRSTSGLRFNNNITHWYLWTQVSNYRSATERVVGHGSLKGIESGFRFISPNFISPNFKSPKPYSYSYSWP